MNLLMGVLAVYLVAICVFMFFLVFADLAIVFLYVGMALMFVGGFGMLMRRVYIWLMFG